MFANIFHAPKSIATDILPSSAGACVEVIGIIWGAIIDMCCDKLPLSCGPA